MANDLKNRSKISTTLKNELHDAIYKLNKDTKIPITRLFDEAVELLLESRGVKIENIDENDK